jgi:quercetin dioxygenase-like cupin family protein
MPSVVLPGVIVMVSTSAAWGAPSQASSKERSMSPKPPHRFVTAAEMEVEELAWGPHEWLCRPGLTDAKALLLVRVRMPPGQGHAFHRHPAMEEIIYVISGRAEQWVDRVSRPLGPGESAHIPRDVVHGTYNGGDETLVFLAILSPAIFEGPAVVDVSSEEPWASLRPTSAADAAAS